jgi:autotransporter strand-loop-strand O-heptosyltransferase
MDQSEADIVAADSASGTEAAPPVAAPADVAAAVPAAAVKPAYPPAAATPTQSGPRGITFDFNLGARVLVPPGEWRVRLSDLDTGNTLFETPTKGAFINSSKRFYVRFGIEVWEGESRIFHHEYDCRDQEVLIQLPVGTLGDTIGWLPYAVRFQERHGCKLTIGMAEKLIPLFADAYPHIIFVSHEGIKPDSFYATYSIGLFFEDSGHIWQPTDFRHVGLHRTAGYILGVDPEEFPPQVVIPDEGRPLEQPYVCIAVQASTACKTWNNPYGWIEVVRMLRAAGYEVVCIDQKAVHGQGLSWTHIPNGARDETGDRPITERARWLKHAEFFVGNSSGLAWLAWAAGIPVVMISGFTHPTNEFHTPYRVINWHACNSCWNDVRERFDHNDYMWCPRHAGTSRQFECTRLITAAQVISAIQRIPGFRDAGREAA